LQIITLGTVSSHTACDAPFTIIYPVASSGLPVTLSVTGPATVSGGDVVTLTGAVGTVTLTASQPGNATYAAATGVSQSFAVAACPTAPASPAAQTITFASIPGHTACDAPFTIVYPAASSGLAVTLSVTGPATVSGGNVVSFTGAVGTVVLTASQAGNSSYAAAPNVVQSFSVAACGPAGVAPVITSPHDIQSGGLSVASNVAAGTVGVPFVPYQITASGSPTSFGALLLPPGLSVDTVTGAITGTPTVASTWFVTLQATNGAFTGTATLIIVIGPAGVVPVVTSPHDIQSGGVSVAANVEAATVGLPITPYQITASGVPTSYDATLLPPGLSVDTGTGAITGTPSVAGTWFTTILATNAVGSGAATLIIVVAPAVIAPQAAAQSSQIVNFSALAFAGSGSQTLTVGFAVSGSGKSLLVRGVGPALSTFGISNALANPFLTLNGPSGVIATNDGWQVSIGGQSLAPLIAATALVGAFPLPNGGEDSALLVTVDGGLYTASVTGPTGTSGVALAEFYDANPTAASRLINASARFNVTGGGVPATVGFVIAGNDPKTVLILGLGPALAQYGVTAVLADPQIAIYSGGTQLASDDNWETGTSTAAQISTASAQVGAVALTPGAKDAALLVTLPPGSFTVQLSGVGNTSGVALIEVFDTE